MNEAHWHLLLNHAPIMGTIGATGILIAGFLFKNDSVKKTALGVYIAAALVGIPAFLTGEGAEELVENLPGVTENFIETHEDLGKILFALTNTLGVLALIGFVLERMKNKMVSYIYIVVLMIGIGASIFAKQVATSGGEIRHTEIRSSAPQAGVEAGQPTENKAEDEKDND